MKKVGTAELKAHLSEHLRAVRAGETIVVLDRREPVARIVPIGDAAAQIVVRPAQGDLHAIALPGPTACARDVVDDLREERADRG